MAEPELEGYDSAEDEDYVPTAGSGSEDEVGSGRGARGRTSRRPPKRAALAAGGRGRGGRVGGIRLDDDEQSAADGSAENVAGAAEAEPTAVELAAVEAQRKAELDALFAAELGGGAVPNKPAALPTSKLTSKKKTKKRKSGAMEFKMPGCAKDRKVQTAKTNETASSTVKVAKTYDFAGETVTVTKEVDANSREAVQFAAAQKQAAQPTRALDSLLAMTKKKSTMSSVTKTRLDWDGFKEKHGITEELANENKDGYLEKMAFLQRADVAAHENELRIRDIERARAK